MFLSRLFPGLKLPAFMTRPLTAPELSCGDCNRVKSCGLPPHADCEEKLLQTEVAKRLNLEPHRSPGPLDIRF